MAGPPLQPAQTTRRARAHPLSVDSDSPRSAPSCSAHLLTCHSCLGMHSGRAMDRHAEALTGSASPLSRLIDASCSIAPPGAEPRRFFVGCPCATERMYAETELIHDPMAVNLGAPHCYRCSACVLLLRAGAACAAVACAAAATAAVAAAAAAAAAAALVPAYPRAHTPAAVRGHLQWLRCATGRRRRRGRGGRSSGSSSRRTRRST